MNYKGLGIAFVVVAAIVIVIVVYGGSSPSVGSAPSGIPATIASTSNPTLTAGTAVGIFATTSCTSRVITTSASAIMLTFTDVLGQTPTGSFGHLQSASTTVAYDSGLYGCGFTKAISFTTQVVTISDVR